MFSNNYHMGPRSFYKCLTLWAHDIFINTYTNYGFSSCSFSQSAGRSAGPDPSCQEQFQSGDEGRENPACQHGHIISPGWVSRRPSDHSCREQRLQNVYKFNIVILSLGKMTKAEFFILPVIHFLFQWASLL
jgi:hypothetical protein